MPARRTSSPGPHPVSPFSRSAAGFEECSRIKEFCQNMTTSWGLSAGKIWGVVNEWFALRAHLLFGFLRNPLPVTSSPLAQVPCAHMCSQGCTVGNLRFPPLSRGCAWKVTLWPTRGYMPVHGFVSQTLANYPRNRIIDKSGRLSMGVS